MRRQASGERAELQGLHVCNSCNNTSASRSMERVHRAARAQARANTQGDRRGRARAVRRARASTTRRSRRSPRPPTSRRAPSRATSRQGGPRVPRRRRGVRRRSRRASRARRRARRPPTRCARGSERWLERDDGARGGACDAAAAVIDADEGLRAHEHRSCCAPRRARRRVRARPRRRPDELEPRMAAAATITVFELLGQALEPADRRSRRGLAVARPRAPVHRRRDRRAARLTYRR